MSEEISEAGEVTTEIVETETVLSQEASDAIAKSVADSMEATITKRVEEALAAKTAQEETSITKNVVGQVDPNIEAVNVIGIAKDLERMGKETRLIRAARAIHSGDSAALKNFNAFNKDRLNEYADNHDEIMAKAGVTGRYISKAGYNNETTGSEGQYLIPDPEFLIDIERFEAQYGVAFAECDVRTTTKTSVKANTGATNVSMYETGEGVVKTGTKATYGQVQINLRKLAAIAVATDEFIDDNAASYWQDIAQGFARERARFADTFAFTEDGTTTAKKGVLNQPGVVTQAVGSAITSMDWDDLLDVEHAMIPEGNINAVHVMHRTVWNQLLKTKASTAGSYLWQPYMGMQTPWGTRVVLSELFRSTSAGEDNQPYTLYGDLKKIKLFVRQDLTLDYSNEGTVHDAGGVAVNLFEQDMTALRAVTRMAALITIPSRFVVTGTGTVS